MSKHAQCSVFACPFLCHKSVQESDELMSRKYREPVLLNVYDMYECNDYLSNFGLGVFHSGVEVYGTEFGYAGHQESFTGIFEIEPRDEATLSEFFNLHEQLKYKQTIQIGYTKYTEEEIKMIINRLGRKFAGNKYHLIHNNCNHFSGAFTKILCKKDIPAWINRLAHVTGFIPFLHRFIPSHTLTPFTAMNNFS